MIENEIDTPEQVDALPAGQWVVAADGTEACLFDTHMGFPQRMWGQRADSKSRIESFTALRNLPLPLHLCDVVEREGHVCKHVRANECGQCMRCGLPGVGEAHELFFDPEGLAAFRAAAIHNSSLAAQPDPEGNES